jgi:hypothetical protein
MRIHKNATPVEILSGDLRFTEGNGKKYWIYSDFELLIQKDGRHIRSKHSCLLRALAAAERDLQAGRQNLDITNVDE